MRYYHGILFEEKVNHLLETFSDIYILSNVKVWSGKLNRETQVDHLIITPRGSMCLELKNFTKELVGDFEDGFWFGYSANRSQRIYNPVYQNYEHIRSLNNAIVRNGGTPVRMHNYVIVPDSCEIKTDYSRVMNLSKFLYKMEEWSVQGGSERNRKYMTYQYNNIKRIGGNYG